MALARVVPLKDASQSAVSSGGVGSAYDLSSVMTAGQRLYAGLHVTTQSTDALQAMVQSASSSGFATATTEFIFNSRTSRGAEWGSSAGVALGSTDRKFFRLRWTLSTGSNSPTAKLLGWVSIQ